MSGRISLCVSIKSSTNVVNADKDTFEQVFHVDIKSGGLRDILRIVLRDLREILFKKDEVTV